MFQIGGEESSVELSRLDQRPSSWSRVKKTRAEWGEQSAVEQSREVMRFYGALHLMGGSLHWNCYVKDKI